MVRLTDLDRLNFMDKLNAQIKRMFKLTPDAEGTQTFVDRENLMLLQIQTLLKLARS